MRTNPRAWLALAATGFCLSAAQAVVRPNFQVSDEVAYFSGAQWGAIEASERRAALVVAPPTGQYVHEPPSGKPLWQATAGRALAFLAPRVGLAPSVTVFRLAGSLCVALAAGLTYFAARRLLKDEALAVAAGLFLATHVGFAAHTAAMAPDLAVFGLGAITIGLGVAARGQPAPRRFSAGALIAVLTGIAFALKDTGIIAGLPVLLLVPAPRDTRVNWPGWILLGLGASVLVASILAASTLGGPSVAAQVAGNSPLNLPTQVANLLVTFWASLGNLGANEVPLPAGAVALALLTSGLGAAGIARIGLGLVHTPVGRTELATTAVVAIAACIPSIARWQFQAYADVLQAKWIFPAMPVLAILTVQGLAAWTAAPARWLPLFAVLALGSNLLFLGTCLVPFYYTDFPSALRESSLYLGGSYGVGTDPAAVRAFVAPPAWFDSAPRMGGALAIIAAATLGTLWMAWRVALDDRERREPSGTGGAPGSLLQQGELQAGGHQGNL